MKLTGPLAVLLVVVGVVALAPSAMAAERQGTRDVLVVSNNWAGSADLVDPHTFRRLKRVNVIPDRAKRVAEIEADPTAKLFFDSIRELIGEGHNQYVDDGFTSPDGRYVYFSRPSFADVVAISLKTGRIRWRTKVDGYRADHMAISRNGRRLLVSRVNGERHRRDSHAHRPDRRPNPVRGRAAREQLLARRLADLPRQHRPRLHRH